MAQIAPLSGPAAGHTVWDVSARRLSPASVSNPGRCLRQRERGRATCRHHLCDCRRDPNYSRAPHCAIQGCPRSPPVPAASARLLSRSITSHSASRRAWGAPPVRGIHKVGIVPRLVDFSSTDPYFLPTIPRQRHTRRSWCRKATSPRLVCAQCLISDPRGVLNGSPAWPCTYCVN
jgi:hypothetical protein